jgi:hypothetical protein
MKSKKSISLVLRYWGPNRCREDDEPLVAFYLYVDLKKRSLQLAMI